MQHEIGRDDPNGIRAAYGVYLLAEHEVWAPRLDSTACAGLAYSPENIGASGAFFDVVVRSDRIAAMLEAAA